MHLIMYSCKLSLLHIQATVLPSSFLVQHPFSCNLASFFRALFIKPRNKTAQTALVSEPHWLIISVTDFSCNEGIATTQLKQWAVSVSFTHAFGVFKHSWPFSLVGFSGYPFYLIWNFICLTKYSVHFHFYYPFLYHNNFNDFIYLPKFKYHFSAGNCEIDVFSLNWNRNQCERVLEIQVELYICWEVLNILT